MNILPENSIVVVGLSEEFIKVVSTSLDKDNILIDLGFVRESEFFLYLSDGIESSISMTNKLIDQGALFSYGHGWEPSQVLEFYRENGHNVKGYKEIMWLNDSSFRIVDK